MLKNGNTTLKGNLTLTNGISSYTLPNVDGTNNQVLKTDGAGNVTWQNASTGTTYTAGTAISVLGDSITNLAPDQIITLQSAGATTVTGSYPSFTISSTDNVNDADADPTNELITSFGLNGTSDTIVLKEGSNTFTIPKASLSDGNGIYSGSGSLTGPTTVTQGANTLIFSGGGMNSTAIFSNGGFLGTNINIEHTGSNGTGIKFRGSTSTTPVDYGYVGASSTGLSIGGGSNSNNLTISTTGNVGINGLPNGGGKFVVNHAATTSEPTIHLRETTGNLNRIKFSNNVVANKYFETAAQTNATDGLGAWSVNYFDGSTYRSHIISYGNGNLAVGKGILAANKSLMDVFGTTTLHDTLTIDNGTGNPYSFPVADGTNPGDVLTTDAAGNTYWAAAGTTSPWTQVGDTIFPINLPSKVGIGHNSPATILHITDNVSLRPEVLLQTNTGNFKIGYRYKTALAEWSMGQGEGTGQKFMISDIQTGITPFVIEQGSGNVGIGISNPLVKLHVAENGQAMIAIQSANNIPNNGSNLTLLRGRGLIGSETPIATNDRIGKIEFVGFDGITYNEAASIRAIADEPFGSTQHGTHLEFHTTPIGVGISSESMRIMDNGSVGIGTTMPRNKLTVNGDIGLNDGANIATNNAITVLLINNTGAVSVPGDIVVVGVVDNSFGLTNVPGNYAVLGVVMEAVASGQPAKIAISGVVNVNIDGSSNVVRGQHCITGNVNGRANGIAIPNAGTSIGVYLTSTAAGGVAKVLLR